MKKRFWMVPLATACLSCLMALNGCGGGEEEELTDDPSVVNPGDTPQKPSSNADYWPMLREDVDVAHVLPPGMYTYHNGLTGYSQTMGKARDGSLVTEQVPRPSGMPAIEILSDHQQLRIQEWKNEGTLSAHEFLYPNIDVFNSEEYTQLPLTGQDELNYFYGMLHLAQNPIAHIWEAYRGIPNKSILTKGGTRTIAGRQCTEWIDVDDQSVDFGDAKFVLVNTHRYWVDKDNNCLRYEYSANNNGNTVSIFEEEISHIDQEDVAHGDDLFAKFYGSDAGTRDQLFRNTRTRFDNLWEKYYPDNFNSCIDWNSVFQGYGVDDLLVPYTGDGTIDFTKVSNDNHSLFDGVFEIQVRVKNPSPESVATYIQKLSSLPHKTHLTEGTQDGVYSMSFLLGDDLSLHSPPLDFGDLYGYIQYDLMSIGDLTAPEVTDIQSQDLSNTFYIIIKIIRDIIV